jgi:hypothetical protein
MKEKKLIGSVRMYMTKEYDVVINTYRKEDGSEYTEETVIDKRNEDRGREINDDNYLVG